MRSQKHLYVRIGQTKLSEDGKTKLGRYDLKIAELWGVGLKYVTFCNYQ